jgi:hypothetical protein
MIQLGHLRSRSGRKYIIALVSFFTTACGLYHLYFTSVFEGISSTPVTATVTVNSISGAEEKSNNNNSSQIGDWISPHQVDCKSFVDESDEIYKQTSTEPPFMMNIHKPSEDEVSRHIWEEGCWECEYKGRT